MQKDLPATLIGLSAAPRAPEPMPLLSFARPHPFATALLLLLGGAPALAQPTAPAPLPLRPQLTPAQQQRLFPEWRRIDQRSVQARLVILQNQERCLAAATDLAALRACQRQERQALMLQRQRQRLALTELFSRNGIQLPPWPQQRLRPWRDGAPGGGAGGANI
jgi:hypothetical protein